MTSEISSPKSPETRQKELPALSIVVPVLNEADNILPLVQEINETLRDAIEFEVIYVDDSSTDMTSEILADLTRTNACLRFLRHKTCAGQSAAIRTGVNAAKFSLIATLDGDGQNVPNDIFDLLQLYVRESEPDGKLLVIGWRKNRKDNWTKKIASKIANNVRCITLGDRTPDTGCGLKLFRREDFLEFPAFNHMHRFLPALMVRAGGRVLSTHVSHRPRRHGVSSYGVFDRLWIGIIDLLGVAWLTRRAMNVETESITPPKQNISS